MEGCRTPKCREELKCEIGKKVSIRVMLGILGSVVTVGAVAATLIYTAYSGAQESRDQKVEDYANITQRLDKNVAVMQQDIKNIKDQLSKQGTKQEKILEILNELRRSGSREDHSPRPR